MRKLLYYLSLMWAVLCLAPACSSDDEPADTPPPAQAETLTGEDYCLMFYFADGDVEHEGSFGDHRNAVAKSLAAGSKVAVTWLTKSPQATVKPVRRYSEGGALVTDDTWDGGDNFDVTSEAALREFIEWSAAKYPGRHYILVTGGHGNVWLTSTDNPTPPATSSLAAASGQSPVTCGLIYDSSTGRSMGASAVARAVTASQVKLDAIITHNCLQGCVETLSEWQDIAHYCVATAAYLPDLAADYPKLMTLLDSGKDLKTELGEYVHHLGDYLLDYTFDNITATPIGSKFSISAIDLTKIAAMNAKLKPVFSEMKESLDRTTTITDAPAQYGLTYAKGYQKALNASLVLDVLNGPSYTHDLFDFLRNAVIYTGHVELMSLLSEAKELKDSALYVNLYSDELSGHVVSLNVLTAPAIFTSSIGLKRYKYSRFDQQTGWSDFYSALLKKQ